MKKRLLGLLLALVMILSLVPETAFAATTVANGTCGTNLTWVLDSEGMLTISGKGRMLYDYSYRSVPWYDYRNRVTSVVINSGITSIE